MSLKEQNERKGDSNVNYRCSLDELGQMRRFIQESLAQKKKDNRTIAKTLLTAEEVICTTIEHAKGPEEPLSIKLISSPWGTELRISARGEPFSIDAVEAGFQIARDVEDAEAMEIVRRLTERVLGENVAVRNRKGLNTTVIKISSSPYKPLILTVGALFLGILAGFLMKGLLPEAFNTAVTENLFAPVTAMFLNALKMVVAPLVLFSIASSIADFGDMKTLGRIAGKVIGSYMITSFIAILLGIAVYQLFPIGDPALQAAVSDAAASTVEKGAGVTASIKDTIVGVIPTDIITPFLKADMLQIIFIAAMLGLAAGALSDKLEVFHDVLSDCYAVFSRITAMIIWFMPLAIFCSMAKMILTMDLKHLLSVFVWVPTIYLADLLMLAVYGLMILVVARLNPLTFFRKYYPAMLTAFTFAASNPSLPTSMATCDKALGISKRLYSFSLPLGATINMDGGCITQIISALFMAKVFGLPINASMILSLVLAIFVLSVGAPGVPGGALVCISILLPQIGIPAEAISIIMGLYSIVGMMQTCVNVTGDAAVTLTIAKSEKLVNLEVYNRRKAA